ncbi:hypothetical protein KIN_19390 [Litoreibacter roseus]|uniref:Uncharacterized protein n=1 Tax=Litoreibacter roseus TaxID=2601869 RepID=A0A6N6JFE2_9RHOB|nr:hypothetical protein KIN_19390 [Litoreibacter roseus]
MVFDGLASEVQRKGDKPVASADDDPRHPGKNHADPGTHMRQNQAAKQSKDEHASQHLVSGR